MWYLPNLPDTPERRIKLTQDFIERRIITGLIVSTDYINRVQRIWSPDLLESQELKTIARWCLDYFEKYGTAPDSNIQSIYMENLPSLSKSDAEFIEEVLEGLSSDYGRGSQFNSAYLYDQTLQYFKTREIEQHQEEVQYLIDEGRANEAEQLIQSFRPTIVDQTDAGLDLSSEEALERIEQAFNESQQRVISYPGALGEMWNEHLSRGGFVTFLAPEKRGKSFMLLELGLRAVRQKANVAFFEAGDMTENQVLRRICVYMAQRSDREKYCNERFDPIGDCLYNMLDICDRSDRNCNHGIFEGVSLDEISQNPSKYLNISTLKEKHEDYPEYEPCDSHSCNQRKGVAWIERKPKTAPLNARDAKEEVRKFFSRYRRHFKLITQPPSTLTVSDMRTYLNNWERYDGFVPDVIIIDYADLLSADDGPTAEFRHRQDHIWKNLRALSQEKHALVLSATQADAESYTRGRLSLSNFSEDKRKLSHVTAQYGLNQDPDGREKKLGVLRVNEIVVREGDFSNDNEVYVLQSLSSGRPFLESFK